MLSDNNHHLINYAVVPKKKKQVSFLFRSVIQIVYDSLIPIETNPTKRSIFIPKHNSETLRISSKFVDSLMSVLDSSDLWENCIRIDE